MDSCQAVSKIGQSESGVRERKALSLGPFFFVFGPVVAESITERTERKLSNEKNESICSVFGSRGSAGPNRDVLWRASANSRGRRQPQDRLRHGALSCGHKRQLPPGRARRSESRL